MDYIIWTTQRLYREYGGYHIGVIQGLHMRYIGIMEKKMEATIGFWVCIGAIII